MIESIIKKAEGRTCHVTGIPRSGSTFLLRELYKRQIKFKALKYADEAFRIVPGVYDVVDGEVINAPTGFIDIPQEYTWPRNYSPEVITHRMQEYKDRINQMKEPDQSCMKVFPVDFEVIKLVDPFYYQKLLSEPNFWAVTYRKKWFEGILSFFYAAETSVYHYYEDDVPGIKDFTLNPRFTKAFLDMYKNLMFTFLEAKNTMYITSEELSAVKPVEINTTNKWASQTPKFFENKMDVLKEKCTNYDRTFEMTKKFMEKLVIESNGFYDLDGEDLYVTA